MVNGLIINNLGMVFSFGDLIYLKLNKKDMKVSFSIHVDMVKEFTHGQVEIIIKEVGKMDINMEEGSIVGQVVHLLMECGKTMQSKGMAHFDGLMEMFLKENGKMGSLLIWMEQLIQELKMQLINKFAQELFQV